MLKLNRNYLVVYLALLISLVYLGFLAASIHEGIFYAGDQALKSMQVKQIAAGHGFKNLYLDQPGWVKATWDSGYYPLRPPFFYPAGKDYLYVYPPLFQIITAPFYSRFGSAGLYMLPMLCTLIFLFWTIRLLKRCGFGALSVAQAILILVFCSPLMLYGVMFWEHLPAVLLQFAGVAMIAAPPAKRWAGTAYGMLCGLAVWLRPEALAMVVLYCAAIAFLFFRDRRAVYLAFGAGVALAILPWFAFNIGEYGSLFGIHGRQVFQDSDPESRISWHNGLRNFLSLNRISFRHFWFLAFLAPVICYRARHKDSDIRPFLLSLIVIGYSVGAPFMLPNDGITQWGPRYFLPVIPVTLIALFLSAKQWKTQMKRPIPVWITILLLIAGLASFYQNTHGGGYKELRWRYNTRLADTYRIIAGKPGNVIIASPHFLSYDFGYLFDRNYFFGASGDDSVRRLLPILKSHGVHEVIILYNPRFHTLPPMFDDSATRHRYDAEAATGWVREDIAYKVVSLDSAAILSTATNASKQM